MDGILGLIFFLFFLPVPFYLCTFNFFYFQMCRYSLSLLFIILILQAYVSIFFSALFFPSY